MNDIPDLPKIPLDKLSNRDLQALLANARRGGRTAMANVAAGELRRRGANVPEETDADVRLRIAASAQTPGAPEARDGPRRWPLGLAAGIAAIVAVSATGGWLLTRDQGSAPDERPVTAAAGPYEAPTRSDSARAALEAPATVSPDVAPREPAATRFASRASAPSKTAGGASRPEAPKLAERRDGDAQGGRLAMARSDPEVLAGAAGAPEILASSGAEIERASDCAAAGSGSVTMVCNDALQVARTERRGRITPTPARIVVARNMPALPSLVGPRR
jgi:hypothetical protein